MVLFPVAVTFLVTWWFIQFFDGFFSPVYESLGIDIFGQSLKPPILNFCSLFFFNLFSVFSWTFLEETKKKMEKGETGTKFWSVK